MALHFSSKNVLQKAKLEDVKKPKNVNMIMFLL